MKPSERRALEAEKRARQEAEWREKELQRQARKAAKQDRSAQRQDQPAPEQDIFTAETLRESADTERINDDATYKKLPEKEIEVKGDGYHRESFWSNHARLIAFIVAGVFAVLVVGPLGYDIYLNVRDYMEGGKDVEGKVLTEETVLTMNELGSGLTWEMLEAFEHTSFGDVIEIEVEGTDLTLRAGRTKSSKYPDYVRLIHYYNDCGGYIKDIRSAKSGEIEDFFASHTAENENKDKQ